jgi:hypothetical protein
VAGDPERLGHAHEARAVEPPDELPEPDPLLREPELLRDPDEDLSAADIVSASRSRPAKSNSSAPMYGAVRVAIPGAVST